MFYFLHSLIIMSCLLFSSVTFAQEPKITTKNFSIMEIQPSNRELQGSLMGGEGTHRIGDISDRRRNKIGSMTISQDDEGLYVIETQDSEDKIWFEMKSFTNLYLIVPAGEGSVYRFRGAVKNFFPGYVFTGDGEELLRFRLSRAQGLMYIGGKGNIVLPDGRVIHF